MRLLVATLLVWAAVSAVAQQPYDNPKGYACNGGGSTCATYALYRTFKEQESLATVAGYFNMAPAQIADGSGLSNLDPNAALPLGQALYVPLVCSCWNGTSQMEVPYTIQQADTFVNVSIQIYGSLTTYQAIEHWNPTKPVLDLPIGAMVMVPIFCACPSAAQTAIGTNYLVTYGVVRSGETLGTISGNFGITTEGLSAANQLPGDATLVNYTTLLVPVGSLPPITTMTFPYVNITQANNVATTSNSHTSSKTGIIAGVVAAGAVVAFLVACFFIARQRRTRASFKEQEKLGSDFTLVDQNLFLRMFTFKELSKATKNFRRSEILGSGGFGAVYMGTLPCGELVAVKRIRMESKHGQESFRAEVTSLSHIRHRNLVQLRGWCHEEEQLLLVYDYMSNGSLYEWLFQFSECCEDRYRKGNLSESLKDAEALPLKLRHSILTGVAGALSYLHEECAQCVLHRDIKSSNVLLDGDLNAYLGDFGLARLIDHRKMARTTMMAGTLGYLAPEMPLTGKATKETDVYSFGILVLEVICGMEPLDVTANDQGAGLLEDRVWRAHESGNILQMADSRLGTFSYSGPSSSSFGGSESPEALMSSNMHDVDSSVMDIPDDAMDEKKMVTNLLQLGLLCCNPSPEARPSMRVVSQLLLLPAEDMEVSMPCLPEWKPQVQTRLRGFSQVL